MDLASRNAELEWENYRLSSELREMGELRVEVDKLKRQVARDVRDVKGEVARIEERERAKKIEEEEARERERARKRYERGRRRVGVEDSSGDASWSMDSRDQTNETEPPKRNAAVSYPRSSISELGAERESPAQIATATELNGIDAELAPGTENNAVFETYQTDDPQDATYDPPEHTSHSCDPSSDSNDVLARIAALESQLCAQASSHARLEAIVNSQRIHLAQLNPPRPLQDELLAAGWDSFALDEPFGGDAELLTSSPLRDEPENQLRPAIETHGNGDQHINAAGDGTYHRAADTNNLDDGGTSMLHHAIQRIDNLEAEVNELRAQQASAVHGSRSPNRLSPTTPRHVQRRTSARDADDPDRKDGGFTPRKRDAFRRLRNADTGLDSLISALGEDGDLDDRDMASEEQQSLIPDRMDSLEDEMDDTRAVMHRMEAGDRRLVNLKKVIERVNDVEERLEALDLRDQVEKVEQSVLDIHSLSLRMGTIEDEHHKLNDFHEDMVERVTNTEGELQSVSAVLARLDTVEKDVLALTGSVAQRDELQKLERNLNDFTRRMDELKQDVHLVKNSHGDMLERTNSTETEIKTIRDSLERVDNDVKVNTALQWMSEIEEEFKQKIKDLGDCIQRVEVIENGVKAVNATLTGIVQRIEDIEAELTVSEKTKLNHGDRLLALENGFDVLRSSLTPMSTLEKDIMALSGIAERVDRLEEQFNQEVKGLDGPIQRLDKIEHAATDAASRVVDVEAELKVINDRVAEALQIHKDILHRVTSTEGELKKFGKALEDVKVDSGTKIAGVNALMEKRNDETDKKLKSLERSSQREEEIKEQVRTVNDALARMCERNKKIEHDVERFSESVMRFDKVENDLKAASNATSRLFSMETDLRGINDRVDSTLQTIGETHQRVSSIETQLQDVGDTSQLLHSMEDELDRVENLENDVNNLRTCLGDAVHLIQDLQQDVKCMKDVDHDFNHVRDTLKDIMQRMGCVEDGLHRVHMVENHLEVVRDRLEDALKRMDDTETRQEKDKRLANIERDLSDLCVDVKKFQGIQEHLDNVDHQLKRVGDIENELSIMKDTLNGTLEGVNSVKNDMLSFSKVEDELNSLKDTANRANAVKNELAIVNLKVDEIVNFTSERLADVEARMEKLNATIDRLDATESNSQQLFASVEPVLNAHAEFMALTISLGEVKHQLSNLNGISELVEEHEKEFKTFHSTVQRLYTLEEDVENFAGTSERMDIIKKELDGIHDIVQRVPALDTDINSVITRVDGQMHDLGSLVPRVAKTEDELRNLGDLLNRIEKTEQMLSIFHETFERTPSLEKDLQSHTMSISGFEREVQNLSNAVTHLQTSQTELRHLISESLDIRTAALRDMRLEELEGHGRAALKDIAQLMALLPRMATLEDTIMSAARDKDLDALRQDVQRIDKDQREDMREIRRIDQDIREVQRSDLQLRDELCEHIRAVKSIHDNIHEAQRILNNKLEPDRNEQQHKVDPIETTDSGMSSIVGEVDSFMRDIGISEESNNPTLLAELESLRATTGELSVKLDTATKDVETVKTEVGQLNDSVHAIRTHLNLDSSPALTTLLTEQHSTLLRVNELGNTVAVHHTKLAELTETLSSSNSSIHLLNSIAAKYIRDTTVPFPMPEPEGAVMRQLELMARQGSFSQARRRKPPMEVPHTAGAIEQSPPGWSQSGRPASKPFPAGSIAEPPTTDSIGASSLPYTESQTRMVTNTMPRPLRSNHEPPKDSTKLCSTTTRATAMNVHDIPAHLLPARSTSRFATSPSDPEAQRKDEGGLGDLRAMFPEHSDEWRRRHEAHARAEGKEDRR